MSVFDCHLQFLKLREGSFAVVKKTFSEVCFTIEYYRDGIAKLESVPLWDVFSEAKEAIVKERNSFAGVGYLRDFFEKVDLNELRKVIQQEHKDEATFNWFVATKIVQPLCNGLVFLDKLPANCKSAKVVRPATDKMVKGLVFGFEDGYHGVPDMLVCCPLSGDDKEEGNKGPTAVLEESAEELKQSPVLVPIVSCEDEDEIDDDDESEDEREESRSKRCKVNDNSPVKLLAEGKNKNHFQVKDFSQCIATITTFAFIQEMRYPGKRAMYPILMISRGGVVMILYSPGTDILLTTPMVEWDDGTSYYVIWLALHYYLFPVKLPAKKLKCGFKENFEKYIRNKQYVYLQPSFKELQPQFTVAKFVTLTTMEEVHVI